MQLSKQATLSDLQSRFEQTLTEEDKALFFIKIADYGEYLYENDITKELILRLIEQSYIDSEPYKISRQKFIDEWRLYANNIIERAKEANITDDPNDITSMEISAIKEKLNQDILQFSYSDVNEYFRPYRKLIDIFIEKRLEKDLIPFHMESKETGLKLYTLYRVTSDEWLKYEGVRAVKVWWAHYQICRATTGILEKENFGIYFNTDYIIESIYKHEFQKLRSGNYSSNDSLKKEDFMQWLQRVHAYLVPRINEYERASAVTSFREDNNEIRVNQSLWELVSDSRKAYIKKNKKIIYTFSQKRSLRYQYFQYLWNHHNTFVEYSELYFIDKKINTFKKINKWKVNRDIRNSLNTLKKELTAINLHIETATGFTFTINS